MQKVKVNTKVRTITKNSDEVITSPEFIFKNTGLCTVFINNLPLLPGDTFGHSVDNAADLFLKGIEIVRDETYSIDFKNYDTTDFSNAAGEVPGIPQLRKTLIISETFYTKL
jgi:hypothetical protein